MFIIFYCIYLFVLSFDLVKTKLNLICMLYFSETKTLYYDFAKMFFFYMSYVIY